MIPMIPAIAAAAASWFTKGVLKDKESDERLELVKTLANLTPAQAQAVDAVKDKPIAELRTRAELGIGPFAPLPANASEKAVEARERRIAALSTKNVGTKLVSAPDIEAAINQKVQEASANRLAGYW